MDKVMDEEIRKVAEHHLYSNILYDDVYVGEPTEQDCVEMFKAGAEWQKEQMMKEAKSGVVDENLFVKFDDGTWIDFDPTMQLKPAFDVKEGEKVKVIIIKEQ